MSFLGAEEHQIQESTDQDFYHGFTSFYSMTWDRLQDLLYLLGFQICRMGIKIPTLQGRML